MNIIINRLQQSENQYLGNGLVYSGLTKLFEFKTLELPWRDNQVRISCIPEGKYRTVKHQSEKFNKSFWLQDVPGRTEILIHVGNYYTQILGCILPGEGFTDINQDGQIDVTSSQKTISLLWDLLPDTFYTSIYMPWE